MTNGTMRRCGAFAVALVVVLGSCSETGPTTPTTLAEIDPGTDTTQSLQSNASDTSDVTDGGPTTTALPGGGVDVTTSSTVTDSPNAVEPPEAGTTVVRLEDLTKTGEDDGSVFVPADSRTAASNLSSHPQCAPLVPGRALVALKWTPAATAASEQRIDLTVFFRGFETGDFVSTPLLSPGQASLVLEEPESGVLYQWRVLTRVGEGWASSEEASFRGPICIVDAEDG